MAYIDHARAQRLRRLPGSLFLFKRMLPIPGQLGTLDRHCPRARSQSLLLAELFSDLERRSKLLSHSDTLTMQLLLNLESALPNRSIISNLACIIILAKWPTSTMPEPNGSEDCPAVSFFLR